MDMTIKRISEELQLQGIKQADLAEFIGVTPNVITDWKSGRIKSYSKYIYGIAKFLNVSVEYLKGETDIKQKLLVNNDEELTEYLEELKNRSEIRMLFSVTKGCTKDEVEQAVRIIEALRKKDD